MAIINYCFIQCKLFSWFEVRFLIVLNVKVRKANPEKNCFLQYDKLYIDSKIYVFNEVLGQVVEHSESVRYGEMMSRPGSVMIGGGGGYVMSRPSSRTGSRPASGTCIFSQIKSHFLIFIKITPQALEGGETQPAPVYQGCLRSTRPTPCPCQACQPWSTLTQGKVRGFFGFTKILQKTWR